MQDYHGFSLEDIEGPLVDHGQILHLKDIPWAKQQLWAPDAAQLGDRYYLFFPAKDANGIFRIGVASSDSPAEPFEPRPKRAQSSRQVALVTL